MYDLKCRIHRPSNRGGLHVGCLVAGKGSRASNLARETTDARTRLGTQRTFS
jgi:hypothetical protein